MGKAVLNYSSVIGIGGIRSGTTWLDAALRNHPQVLLPTNVKEINYFNTKYDKGQDWYLSHFPEPKKDTKVWGEITPTYLNQRSALERIIKDLPRTKVIAFLRNPYDRAVSMYGYQLKYGQKNIGIINHIKSNKVYYLGLNLLSENLKICLDYFADDLFIFLFDRLGSDAETLYADTLRFIGVDHHPAGTDLSKAVHSQTLPRNRMLSQLATKTARTLRNTLEFNWLADRAKHSGLVQFLLYGADENRYNPTDDELNQMKKIFQPDFEKEITALENILGQDLKPWRF